jgi:hypothetical protein
MNRLQAAATPLALRAIYVREVRTAWLSVLRGLAGMGVLFGAPLLLIALGISQRQNTALIDALTYLWPLARVLLAIGTLVIVISALAGGRIFGRLYLVHGRIVRLGTQRHRVRPTSMRTFNTFHWYLDDAQVAHLHRDGTLSASTRTMADIMFTSNGFNDEPDPAYRSATPGQAIVVICAHDSQCVRVLDAH